MKSTSKKAGILQMLRVQNCITIIITLISMIEENMSFRTYIISLYLLGVFFFKCI